MDILVFEDDELDLMIEAINKLQMLFHPTYAPCGDFSFDAIRDLEQKDVAIFIDNNILSPIYELITTGTSRDQFQAQKVAMFILFTRYIRAQLTCGLALFENDTAQKSTIPAEEKRQSFLYGVDKIPSIVWKKLAFGDIVQIPSVFLASFSLEDNDTNYSNCEELHFLMHRVAIAKMVCLLKDSTVDGFQRYLKFFEWYADHLLIAESLLVYAALVFGNVENVAAPKNYKSKDFQKVIKGINNQAWDMFYLTHWSTYYYTEAENQVFMFATDDVTQKMIIANNSLDEFVDLAATIFHSKKQKEQLRAIFESKLGNNRKVPLKKNDKQHNIEMLKNLYNSIEAELQSLM